MCIAMTKSDVKVAILDLNTLSNCSYCGSNEKLDEVVTPSRTTPLRSDESATAAAMSALVDDEAAENVTPRTDELAAAMTTENEIDANPTPIRTGTSTPAIAAMPTMMDGEEAAESSCRCIILFTFAFYLYAL